MLRILLLILILTSSSLAAPDLSGKEVLLIVSAQRSDLDGEWLELALRGMRHDLGLTTADIPVVRMGFDDTDAQDEHFERLGISKENGPFVCLARWGSPATTGPQSIVDELLIEKAERGRGLEEPRSLFVAWLKRTGRSNLVPIITPPPPEPALIEVPDPALEAYEQRRFAEAIRLARASGSREIEEKAKADFQQQAALALAEERDDLALSVYAQLSELYPDDKFYRHKVRELQTVPADLIAGKWKVTSSSGWIEFTASRDGNLKGKGALYLLPIPGSMKGHWEVTGDKERTFQLHWTNGHLHNIQIHENGETFEGKGLSDGNVSGKKLSEI
jgi:hypothetical protein